MLIENYEDFGNKFQQINIYIKYCINIVLLSCVIYLTHPIR